MSNSKKLAEMMDKIFEDRENREIKRENSKYVRKQKQQYKKWNKKNK